MALLRGDCTPFHFFMLPIAPARVFDSMNKHISLKRAAFTAVALGVLSATAAFAQTAANDTTTTSTGTGGQPNGGGWHHHHHHASVLSQTERAELKKDKDQALAANPALKTQEDSLHQQFKALRSANPPATKAQFEALKTQHEALKTQMRTAIESTDAGAAALFQKIDAAKGQHHHHGTT
jgi:hypothetical protein